MTPLAATSDIVQGIFSVVVALIALGGGYLAVRKSKTDRRVEAELKRQADAAAANALDEQARATTNTELQAEVRGYREENRTLRNDLARLQGAFDQFREESRLRHDQQEERHQRERNGDLRYIEVLTDLVNASDKRPAPKRSEVLK